MRIQNHICSLMSLSCRTSRLRNKVSLFWIWIWICAVVPKLLEHITGYCCSCGLMLQGGANESLSQPSAIYSDRLRLISRADHQQATDSVDFISMCANFRQRCTTSSSRSQGLAPSDRVRTIIMLFFFALSWSMLQNTAGSRPKNTFFFLFCPFL